MKDAEIIYKYRKEDKIKIKIFTIKTMERKGNIVNILQFCSSYKFPTFRRKSRYEVINESQTIKRFIIDTLEYIFLKVNKRLNDLSGIFNIPFAHPSSPREK